MSFPDQSLHNTRLVVDAEFDPQLPARVLGRFSVTGQLPERFIAERVGPDRLRLTVDFRAGDPEQARLLAARLEAIPSVGELRLSLFGALARSAA